MLTGMGTVVIFPCAIQGLWSRFRSRVVLSVIIDVFLLWESSQRSITHNVENSLCSSLPSDIQPDTSRQVELVDVPPKEVLSRSKREGGVSWLWMLKVDCW